MATSNSTNFTQTRNEIIADVYQILGVYGSGDTVSSNDYTLASNLLNKMVKAWQAQGIHLWTEQEAALFLTEGKQSYSLSSSATEKTGDDPIYTTLSAAASSSATSLTVTSTSGMTAADNIGIKLDDNTLHWTTIVSVDSSTALTITSGLASAAASGNNVFTFTTRTDRPLHISSARFRHASGTERPLEIRGRTQFMQIPNKSSTGKANQCYYSPKVSTATFYVWPTADDVGDCIPFSYVRRIQDFDASSDTPDLPQEWLEPITYNLAVRVAPAFGINIQKKDPSIAVIAAQSLMDMMLWDSEEGSVHIVPNYRFD
jgi:uncharacterized protein YaiI (UPF0178 family)